MSEMTDYHRMFLQGLMSRRSGTKDEMVELLELCINKNDGERSATFEELEGVVKIINKNIRSIHMEVKVGVNELNGTRHYALVNTCETAVAKLSTDYSVNELEFFKKIVEAMVGESEDGELSSIVVLNLVDKLEKKFTKREAQDVIERFINDDWLVETQEGGISLHVRALIELEHYIKEVFPDDVVICSLCKQIVMKGQECSNCDVKLHNHCALRLAKQGANAKCPKCKTQWLQD